jgi:hypothetical protein
MADYKITEAERLSMKKKSAQSLPDVPSILNWTPQQFKDTITKVLFDNSNSFYYFINRLADGLTTSFEDYYTKIQLDEKFGLYVTKAVFDLAIANIQATYLTQAQADDLYVKKGQSGTGFVTYQDLEDELKDYLAKVTTTTTNDQIYIKNANGTQGMLDVTSFVMNSKLSVTASAGTVPLRDGNSNIKTSTPKANDDSANKKYVDDQIKTVNDKIATINSINALNKNGEAINATSDTVQTVATDYIVTNYGRQPKFNDGLYITRTDIENDVILYAYMASGAWVNVGTDSGKVNLDNYYTKDQTYSKDEVYKKTETYAKSEVYNKNETYNKDDVDTVAETEALNKAGYEYLIGFTGTKQNGNIAFTLDTSLQDFVIKNSTAYAISLAYTGDLTKTDTITLIDKDGHTINLNCIKKPSITTTSTIEDFAQVHRIDSNNIHRWEFRARYSEQTQSGTLYRNFYTDSITNAVDVQYVTLTSDSGSGTLTDAQLATLQASKENKIIYDNEVYILAGNNHTMGYLVYSCLDAENNTNVAKTITITISVKSWLMASHDILYTAGNGIKIENNKISLDVGNAETTSF